MALVSVLFLLLQLGAADDFKSAQLGTNRYQELITPFVKSASDDREYLGLVLSNQLEVLLVSDPKADLAAAALDVAVGSMKDPESMPGLAHFCEHLLFMGNAKYPETNSYFEHLKSSGGMANAYTAYDHTNYYFSVGHENLNETLDRFSQFFISPLFSAESVEKEVNAVNSEHQKNLQSDPWRIHQVQLTTLNNSHPFSRFSTGTYDTLFKLPKSNLIDPRQQIIDYYTNYYSANQMRLVVIGRESIEDLKKFTIPKFSDIPNSGIPRPSVLESPFSKDTLGVEIDIEPVGSGQNMVMQFPLPTLLQYYKEKPGQFISHSLGHEGPGSVIDHLKKVGWATSMSAGVDEGYNDFSVMEITIELTHSGLENRYFIAQLVMEYIELIKAKGVTKERFDEMAAINEIGFKFLDRADSANYASSLATLMHRPAPLAEKLSSAFLMTSFNQILIQNVLLHLNKDNLRLSVIADFPGPHLTEPWYGTNYKINQIPNFNTTKVTLHLPPPNPYIPNNFDIVNTNPEIHLLRNTSKAILWYAGNPTNTPKASVRLLIKNSIVSSSPNMRANLDLLTEAIKEELNAFGYNAIMAGLEYKVDAKTSGISIIFEGYNQKMELFISEIMQRIKIMNITSFDLCKEKRLQTLKDLQFDAPYKQAAFATQASLVQNVWPYEMLIAETELASLPQLNAFAKTILESAQLEMLVVGNLDENAANSIMEASLKTLQLKSPGEEFTHPIRSVIMPQKDFVTKVNLANRNEPNSAIVYYLDMYTYSDAFTRTCTELLTELLSEPAFNQLRTIEQLGYIVATQQFEIGSRGGVAIIVQSELDPIFLESRIENLIGNFHATLKGLSEEKYNRQVTALKSSILEKHRNLKEVSDFHWASITSAYYDFNKDNITLTMLDKIKKSHLLNLLESKGIRSATNRRKLSSHVVSQLAKPIQNFTLESCGTLINNFTAWRDQLQLEPCPVRR